MPVTLLLLGVADSDRDRAAELLRHAAAEGRITFDELDERISLAYAAKTFADLEALTSDLPGPGVTVPAPVSRRVQPPGLAGDAPVPKFSVAIMSGAKRAGPWLVPPTYSGKTLLSLGLPGDVLDDICPARLTLRPVDMSWRMTSMFAVSDEFYGFVRPPYLQVVWADRNDRFPWEPRFQTSFDGLQPLLWLPRDDNPPSPWTRTDRVS